MLQWSSKKPKNKGFSLIELLATVAIPAYNKYRDTAAQRAADSEASQIFKALQACLTEKVKADCATATIDDTISASCNAAAAALPTSSAFYSCAVGVKSGTDDVCVSAHREGVGAVKHSCWHLNAQTGQVTPPLLLNTARARTENALKTAVCKGV